MPRWAGPAARALGHFTEERMAVAIDQLHVEALAARGSAAGNHDPARAV
jgi:hypothetical protein